MSTGKSLQSKNSGSTEPAPAEPSPGSAAAITTFIEALWLENLSEKSPYEIATLAGHKVPDNVRLACQTLVLGDAVIRPYGA